MSFHSRQLVCDQSEKSCNFGVFQFMLPLLTDWLTRAGALELPWKLILHIRPARYCPTRFRIRAGQIMVSGSVTKI
jgi:hypothetical protein